MLAFCMSVCMSVRGTVYASRQTIPAATLLLPKLELYNSTATPVPFQQADKNSWNLGAAWDGWELGAGSWEQPGLSPSGVRIKWLSDCSSRISRYQWKNCPCPARVLPDYCGWLLCRAMF
jgi:hypothetical protein